LLVNKDRSQAHSVRIVFHDSSVPNSNPQADSSFSGPVSVVTFGSAQYQWRPNGKDGHAEPDGPALKSTVSGQADTLYTLPAASITVLRGQISGPN